MRLTLLALGILVQCGTAETADELARRVIEENPSPTINLGAPNRLDEEMLVRVAAVNSQGFLEAVMLSNQVSERVRLAFAIRVLNERIRNGVVVKEHAKTDGNGSKIEATSRQSLSAAERIECQRQIGLLAKRISVLPLEDKKPNKAQ